MVQSYTQNNFDALKLDYLAPLAPEILLEDVMSFVKRPLFRYNRYNYLLSNFQFTWIDDWAQASAKNK